PTLRYTATANSMDGLALGHRLRSAFHLRALDQHLLGRRLDRSRGLGRGLPSAERVADRGPARILDLGESREPRVRDHRFVDGAARNFEPLPVDAVSRRDAS